MASPTTRTTRRLLLPADPTVEYIDIRTPTNPLEWRVKTHFSGVAAPLLPASVKATTKDSSGSGIKNLVRKMTPNRLLSSTRASTHARPDPARPVLNVDTLPAFEALARVHSNVFLSVQQDALGQHTYLSVQEARDYVDAALRGDALPPIRLWPEAEVKVMTGTNLAVALNTTPVDPPSESRRSATGPRKLAASLRGGSSKEAKEAGSEGADGMCPRQGDPLTNYHCIEALTLAPDRRVLLADESTLTRGDPTVPIFQRIVLVVNTHEDEAGARRDKYKVGGDQPPDVVFLPIHKMYPMTEARAAAAVHEVQDRMWAALQRGSVVVHCLAGLHRAPTMVACHFLYRFYVLRMKETCHEVSAIYGIIRDARPYAEPLGYIDLIRKYERFLKKQYPLDDTPIQTPLVSPTRRLPDDPAPGPPPGPSGPPGAE